MKRTILLMLLASACARKAPTQVAVPEDIAYVSVLKVGPDGTVVEAGPITRWATDQLLPIYAGAEDNLAIVGWTEAQLAAAEPPIDAKLQVVTDKTCATRLPAPRFFGHLSTDGALSSADVAGAPPLTSPDFEICSGPASVSLVVSGCMSCSPRVSDQGACRYRYDFEDCNQGFTDTLAYADGGGCFLPPTAEGAQICTPLGATAGATDASVCTIFGGLPLFCQLFLFRAPPGPPFEAFEISFSEGPDFLPEHLRRFGSYGPQHVPIGYAHDLVVYERELLISTTGTKTFEGCNGGTPLPAGLLQRWDLDGALVGTASVPGCLTQMRSDPEGTGFVALYHNPDGAWRLGRFLRDGTLTEDQPIIPSDGATLTQFTAHPWMLEPLGPNWFVVFGGVLVVNRLRTEDRVHAFVQTSLAPLRDRALGDLGVTAAIRLNAQTILLGGTAMPSATWFDVGSFDLTFSATLPIDVTERASDGVYDLLSLEDRILVAASPPTAIFGYDRSANYLLREFLENGNAKPQKLILLPEEQMIAVIATRNRGIQGEVESVVAFYDIAAKRFRPGIWPIGHGPVSAAGRDPLNRVYVLLPWAHKVVRLTFDF